MKKPVQAGNDLTSPVYTNRCSLGYFISHPLDIDYFSKVWYNIHMDSSGNV